MGVFRDIKIYTQNRKWVREYYRNLRRTGCKYDAASGDDSFQEAFAGIQRNRSKLYSKNNPKDVAYNSKK